VDGCLRSFRVDLVERLALCAALGERPVFDWVPSPNYCAHGSKSLPVSRPLIYARSIHKSEGRAK
jgi:hypothetical protein